MVGPSTEPNDSQATPKITKQYIIFVIVLSLGLVTLCTVLDHIRPIDFGPAGRFGPRVWLYDSPGTSISYGGDSQIVTSNDAGTKVIDLPVKEVFRSQERLWTPVVSGYWLAYEEQTQQAPKQIKVLNFNTGQAVALGYDELGQGSPAMSGNWVAFVERSPNDDNVSDIYAYDLSKGTRLSVAVEEGKVHCCPKVSEQWVIYLQGQAPWDSRRTSIELRAHSLVTGEDFAIGPIPAPNNASFGTFHALDGDKVAWVRNEPDYKASVHLFDLTARQDRALTLPRSGYIGDISITDRKQLVVFSNMGWEVLDWSQSQPEIVILPWSTSLDYLRAAGDFLVGKTSRDLFVTQILP